MIRSVEVYIRHRELKVGKAVYVGPPSDGVYLLAETTHHCMEKERFESQELVPEADRLALQAAREFARERGLRLEVYNVLTVRGRLKARLRRVKKVPAIVLGKVRFEGENASELFESGAETRSEKSL